MAYRIRDWNRHFENASSRKLKRLEWVAIPNKMDGSGYCALLDHPDGCTHLGAWYAIVEIASRREIRGTLPPAVGKNPHDVGGICQSLGRISRIPWSIFMDVIPRLLEIGWIEEINVLDNQSDTDKLGESANVVGESANVVGDIEGKGTTTNYNGRELHGRELQRKPSQLASVSEFPLTREELRKHDPGVDDVFVRRLVQQTAQDLISMDDMEPFDDEDLANAIRESYATYTGKRPHGNGLLLGRVARIIHNWPGEKNVTTKQA